MVSAGVAEKDGEKLHDSAVLIDHDGTLLLKYRKRRILTNLMTPPYSPGTKAEVAETRNGRIGLLICADTFVEDYLHEMRGLRPELVLVPYGWAAENSQWPAHGKQLAKVVCEAAKTIRVPVVGVDSVGAILHGPWQGRTFGGQSVMSDAAGTILAVAADRDVDVVTVDLTLPS
jgi:N-carbamoylputrescine amidase